MKDAIAYIYNAVKAGGCDLHLHTRFSDGADTVPVLVQSVMANRLNCFSVTDHDSIDAIPEVISLLGMLKSLGFACPEFIPGIELSVDYEKEIHVLGYFPFGGYEKMEDFINHQMASRQQRNRELCGCLTRMGMPVTIEELNAEGDNTVGRLHAAKILMRKGYVDSVSDAFDNLFGYGKPCYIRRDKPGVQEAFSCIRNAGGVPVLAHPYLYKWTGGTHVVSPKLMDSLRILKDNGLAGVEAFHGESTKEQREETYAAALACGLIPTAGSDYHGSNKPGLAMYGGGSSFLTAIPHMEAAAIIEMDGKIALAAETIEEFVRIYKLPCISVLPGSDLEGLLTKFVKDRISPDLSFAGHYATAFSSSENRREILTAYRFVGEVPPDGALRFLSFQELSASRLPATHAEIISALREISLFER
ncbi:MAG: PHP domain-containing protein [Saccharofermentanales bacterium]